MVQNSNYNINIMSLPLIIFNQVEPISLDQREGQQHMVKFSQLKFTMVP